MLTNEQSDQYQRDGFLVIPGFKSLDQIAALRRRAEVNRHHFTRYF